MWIFASWNNVEETRQEKGEVGLSCLVMLRNTMLPTSALCP